MNKLVANNATLSCDQGTAPSTLTVTKGIATGDDLPLATVEDRVPQVNIAPFGLCRSMENPQVASASSTAGTLTPQPCMPVVNEPWSDETGYVTVEGVAAVVDTATCRCQWAGMIRVDSPGTDHGVE